MKGTLYLVPTPIGNLEDMTVRALNVLKGADLLAAEDTRHTLKLCTHFDIHTPLFSYHEHNKQVSGAKLLTLLEAGKTVALVSDAGMPGISDPGADLVAECVEHHIPVIPLPGANAALTALIASGLMTDHFFFYGFLPRGRKDAEVVLQALRPQKGCLVFYESPLRIEMTLERMERAFGARRAVLARELTKRFETFLRGSITELRQFIAAGHLIKGECCLIIDGARDGEVAAQPEAHWWDDMAVPAHVNHYIDMCGMTVKEAVRQAAVDRGVPKRDVYHIFHRLP